MLGDALRSVIGQRRAIDAAFLEELEDVLLSADIGITKTDEILDELRQRYKDGEMAEGEPDAASSALLT